MTTAADTATSAPARAGQYLTFNIGDQSYGLPVATVREIIRLGDITEVPQAHKVYTGVMNLRGKIIPVVSLRERMALDKIAATKQTCVIVTESTLGLIGIIVDSVNSVIEFQEAQLEAAPAIGTAVDQGFVNGLGKLETEVTVLIDIVRCLSYEHFAVTKSA